METFDITKYINIALNRIYWIIIPFMLVVIGGIYYILNAPRIYEAETLILVQSQSVPEDIVQPIVSSELENRLRTITEQVTSRTNLEGIIQEYGLFNSPAESDMLLEDKVQAIRDSIDPSIGKTTSTSDTINTFSIKFRYRDPQKTMQVTNALASNFISESLKIRESQALGTASFLSDELQDKKKELTDIEEVLKEYQLKYMGAMPDDKETNLSVLSRLQMQLDQLNNNLNSLESRKLIIQQQIADSEILNRQTLGQIDSRSPTASIEDSSDLASSKRQLLNLESKYTANHPDVIRLKEQIAKLETEKTQEKSEEEGQLNIESTQEETPAVYEADTLMTAQLQQVNMEIDNTKKEIKDIESKITVYQRMIDETPKRQQELLSLNRDYENIKNVYNSLLNRKLEADIAVSMEKKQKGEQLKVIDSAKVPTRPVEPDIKKLLLIILALGAGLGCGLAYLVEFLDTSYKDPEELEKELQLPLLMSVPILYTEKELKSRKFKKILTAVSVTTGFMFALIAVVIAAKGVDGTITFIKGILSSA